MKSIPTMQMYTGLANWGKISSIKGWSPIHLPLCSFPTLTVSSVMLSKSSLSTEEEKLNTIYATSVCHWLEAKANFPELENTHQTKGGKEIDLCAVYFSH